MKWFKHEANARNDVKLRLLMQKHGIVGYGVYFVMLELIAEYATEKNLDEWGFVDKFYKVPTLAIEARVEPDQLREILKTCNDLDLFQEKSKRLFCRQILSRLDEYASRVKRRQEKKSSAVPIVSGQSPSREEKNRVEEKREEKNIPAAGGSNDDQKNGEPEKSYTPEPLVEYCREVQKMDKQFVNYGKQLNHLKRIREQYTDEEDIKFVMDEMAAEKYWQENPFDMADVANNMYKYLNRTVYLEKGGKHNTRI